MEAGLDSLVTDVAVSTRTATDAPFEIAVIDADSSASLTLTGTPSIGDTWQLTLRDASGPIAAATHVVSDVTGNPESVAEITTALVAGITAPAGYTIAADTADPERVLVTSTNSVWFELAQTTIALSTSVGLSGKAVLGDTWTVEVRDGAGVTVGTANHTVADTGGGVPQSLAAVAGILKTDLQTSLNTSSAGYAVASTGTNISVAGTDDATFSIHLTATASTADLALAGTPVVDQTWQLELLDDRGAVVATGNHVVAPVAGGGHRICRLSLRHW